MSNKSIYHLNIEINNRSYLIVAAVFFHPDDAYELRLTEELLLTTISNIISSEASVLCPDIVSNKPSVALDVSSSSGFTRNMDGFHLTFSKNISDSYLYSTLLFKDVADIESLERCIESGPGDASDIPIDMISYTSERGYSLNIYASLLANHLKRLKDVNRSDNSKIDRFMS